MTATIQINKSTATIKQGEWSSKDELLLARCERISEDVRSETTAYIPDWDFFLATSVAEKLGGRVTEHTPEPYDPNAKY